MEIVLLYKFYIFSFLNLKEGRREGRKEASCVLKQGYRAQRLPGKWHAHLVLTDGWEMQPGHLKVTGVGFSIPVGQRPLFPQ